MMLPTSRQWEGWFGNMPLPLRNCKLNTCNQLFLPKRKNQEFHTAKCREMWYSLNYFKREIFTRTCPVCGDEFTTTRPKQRIYCPDKDCLKIAQQMMLFGMPLNGEIVEGGTCQLCGKERKILGVHHNNGTRLNVCISCNVIVKGIDAGLDKKYSELLTR